MHELSLLVAKREPGLPRVWSFVDGLNLTIENPSDLDIQNAHYNGWLHYTACSSLLLWSADGLIRFATLNCPGSWHDSKIGTYGFYDAVRTQPCGYHIAGDSAFKTKLAGLLVVAKSSARRPADPRANLEWQKLQSALVSVRQCAEWGMGTFQATWKRTRTRLPYNPWYRKPQAPPRDVRAAHEFPHPACWAEPNQNCIRFPQRAGVAWGLRECVWNQGSVLASP